MRNLLLLYLLLFGSAQAQVIVTKLPTPPAGNSAPVWNCTPGPEFTEGVAASYEFSECVSDADADTLTLAEETGCTYPTGISLDDANDQLDASTGTSAGTTTGCVVSADDGVNSPVNSNAFSVVINAAAGGGLRAEYAGLTQYFVDCDSGSNGNNGLSIGQAWATIQYAAANVPAGGNIVLVHDGPCSLSTTATVANSGTSESVPLVFASAPGEFITLQAGSAKMFTLNGVDHVWFDGFVVNGNGNSLKGFELIGVDAIRFRHNRFTNFDLIGDTGASGVGTIWTGNVTTNVVLENNRWDNISWDGNSNAAALLLYRPEGWIFRYNEAIDLPPPWIRNKSIDHNGPSVYTLFYRNHLSGDADIVVNGANDDPASPVYGTYRFIENLLVESSIGVGNGDENFNGENHFIEDLLAQNNTVINAALLWGTFADRGNQAGTIACNNIVYRDDGGSVWVDSSPHYGTPLDTGVDRIDYNGYAMPDLNDWNFHFQYNPTGDDTWTEWRAHTGTSGVGFDANSVRTTSPGFVNAAGGDYRLDTGSPFIDAGKDNCATGGNDIDLGAFALEYWLPDVGPTPMQAE